MTNFEKEQQWFFLRMEETWCFWGVSSWVRDWSSMWCLKVKTHSLHVMIVCESQGRHFKTSQVNSHFWKFGVARCFINLEQGLGDQKLSKLCYF
jgi:hypothetical protein